MNFNGEEFSFEELKQEMMKSSGRDKWILRQLCRGLRPIEIQDHPRSDYSKMQVIQVFQNHMGEGKSVFDCRKALYKHIASGMATSQDASIILDHER